MFLHFLPPSFFFISSFLSSLSQMYVEFFLIKQEQLNMSNLMSKGVLSRHNLRAPRSCDDSAIRRDEDEGWDAFHLKVLR